VRATSICTFAPLVKVRRPQTSSVGQHCALRFKPVIVLTCALSMNTPSSLPAFRTLSSASSSFASPFVGIGRAVPASTSMTGPGSISIESVNGSKRTRPGTTIFSGFLSVLAGGLFGVDGVFTTGATGVFTTGIERVAGTPVLTDDDDFNGVLEVVVLVVVESEELDIEPLKGSVVIESAVKTAVVIVFPDEASVGEFDITSPSIVVLVAGAS